MNKDLTDLSTDASLIKDRQGNTVYLKEQRQQHEIGTCLNRESDDQDETSLKQLDDENIEETVHGTSVTYFRSTATDGVVMSRFHLTCEKEKFDKIFLYLKGDCKNWQSICASLGYPRERFFHLPADGKDCLYVKHLQIWYECIVKLRFNGVRHLYWALEENGLKEQQRTLLHTFGLKEPPLKTLDSELQSIKDKLKLEVIEFNNPNSEGQLHVTDEDQLFEVCKEISDNLSSGEIEQIKKYLNMTDKKHFGRMYLEKINTGIDIADILKQRDLLRVDKLDYLKKILNWIKRKDLLKMLQRIDNSCQYQRMSIKENKARTKNYQNGDLETSIKHDEQMLHSLRKVKIQQDNTINDNETSLAIIHEKSKQEEHKYIDCQKEKKRINEKKKIIHEEEKRIDEEKKRIDEEKKKIDEEKKKIDDEKKKIDDEKKKIDEKKKELAKQEQNNLNLEASLDQTRTDLTKEKEEKKQMLDKEKSKRRDLEIEIEEVEKEMQNKIQKFRNNQCRKVEREQDKVSTDDLDTDANPTGPTNLVSKEYRQQHAEEPQDTRENKETTNGDLLIFATKEDEEQMKAFHDDLNQVIKENDPFKCKEIVAEKTQQFLNSTDMVISQAKIVFILISETFTDDYWPSICQMNNLNAALYDKSAQPLIVPVAIQTNVEFPMGLKSIHKLQFYRRDGYYKNSLAKLVDQMRKE